MDVRRHLRSIIALPLLATVIIPTTLVLAEGENTPAWERTFAIGFPLALGSILIIILGLLLMFSTISLFIREGHGTLAPWDPPSRLVISGAYRYVRNPMISGVIFVLLGEAILLGSTASLIWFCIFLLGNMIYIPVSEEKGLEARFGSEYLRYKSHVPRWIPRLSPWRNSNEDIGGAA